MGQGEQPKSETAQAGAAKQGRKATENEKQP